MISPDTAVVICRFAVDAAALFLWGVSFYLLLLVRAPLRTGIWDDLQVFLKLAVAVAVVATLTVLPARVATIGEGWRDALDPGMLRDVLLATTVGTAWLVQFAGLLMVLVVATLPYPFRIAGTFLAAMMLLLSLSVSGHAAMHGGWLRDLHRANDILHVAAAGFWFGALLPVFKIMRRLDDPLSGEDARRALMRFSTAGHVAVGIVLLSGVANSLLVLQRLPSDLSSPYLQLLAIKIALVMATVAVALANRYFLVPKMGKSATASRALAVATILEMVILLVVIAVVAWFGTLDP